MEVSAEKENRKMRKVAEKGIWKNYIRLLFKAKLPWFWIIFLTILYMGQMTLSLMFPQYASQISNGVLTKPVIIGTVAVIIGDVVVSGIVSYFGKLTAYKVDISYRNLIWTRLMRSPIRLYDKLRPNELVSRTANDTSTIGEVVAGVMPTLVSLVYSLFFIIQTLISYDWRLALGLIIYTPVYIAANIWYGKWNYRTNKYTHNRLASLTQFLSELLVSVPLIKSFAQESKENERGRENIQVYYKANLKRSIVNWINTPLTSVLSVIMDLFVIIFGIYLVSNGTISIGVWIAFFMYVGMYFGILETVGTTYILLKQSQGATSRIAVLVEGDLEQYEREYSLDKDQGDIVFDHVHFSYDEKEILTDVSFTIPENKLTAIVGPSGSGKSTILSIIQQLYEPNQGEILFNGQSIRNYHLPEWRGLFSYVAQDSPLFNGTIRDNIIYGVDREVSEFELINAAKAANALSFIKDSPKGFDTLVGENGDNLSGGQRQRVAIARAILRDANFLLLDEAMASLDGQSEKVIQEALTELMANKTTIIIAHDLSTIRNADQIVLLNDGKVEAIGTHDDLMLDNKLYYQFVLYLTKNASS